MYILMPGAEAPETERMRKMRQMMMRALTVGGLAWAVAGPAAADVLITVEEVGGNVVMNYAGTLDVSSLTTLVTDTEDDHRVRLAGTIANEFATVGGGTEFNDPFVSQTDSWNSGADVADSFSGSLFTLTLSNLLVRTTDITGSTWSGAGQLQWDNTDVAGLQWDLDEDRVWTLNNSAADTITLTVIPEPGSLALLGAAGLAYAARRRR